MRGYTTKHLIDTIENEIYTFYLYSSGGVLCTVKVVFSANGRTEQHNFRGQHAARKWIEGYQCTANIAEYADDR